MSGRRRPRLLYAVTHPVTARLLLAGQPAWMRERGFDVAVAAAPGPDLDAVADREAVEVLGVPMRRDIAPFADLRSLGGMRSALRAWRPDAVVAGTPKAGLVGTVAAWSVGVPVRIYHLRGLRLETTRGPRRAALAAAERTAARLAHRVVAVSDSLARRYVAEGFAPPGKVRVLADGSSNGVDPDRFHPPGPERLADLRERLGLPGDAPVVGFVGRLTRDKGVEPLLEAFDRVAARRPGARLLLVGALEAGDPLPPPTAERIETRPDVVRAGFVDDVAPFYALMDVLAFPSRREGFPNAPLEAACAGVPTVGFRVTGTVDAVVAGETGIVVDDGDAPGLADAIGRYLDDPGLRARHGTAARDRARRSFRRERVWTAWAEAIDALLEGAARPTSTGSGAPARAGEAR